LCQCVKLQAILSCHCKHKHKHGRLHNHFVNWKNTVNLLFKHYAEDLTMEECSRMCFMSYSYFSKKFKQITGKTFKNYLLATRINHAQKLLMTTEKPITQISSECGFNNVSYFSALYKKMKGMSPSIVREQVGSAFKKET